MCDQLFCRRHLSDIKGVNVCVPCQDRYRQIVSNGPVSDADEARIVRLLTRDVASTVNARHEAAIIEVAARLRLYVSSLEEYESRVVDDLQQYLHDTFADTIWPRCPHHPNHPLWHSDGWWCCTHIGVRVRALGSLGEN